VVATPYRIKSQGKASAEPRLEMRSRKKPSSDDRSGLGIYPPEAGAPVSANQMSHNIPGVVYNVPVIYTTTKP